MPLQFPAAPAGAFEALKKGLHSLSDARRTTPSGAEVLALPTAPQAMKPIPVHLLGLDRLTAGEGPDAAALTSWRYFLVADGQVSQAATVVGDGTSGYRFTALTTGFIAGVEAALSRAATVTGGEAYELRLLNVPALNLMALWLKSLGGGEDRFLVLEPAPSFVDAGRTYSAGELLPLLRQRTDRLREPPS